MSTRTVTTQAELDAALAKRVSTIIIDSPRGVWLTISDSGSATVRASGSATVRAWDSCICRVRVSVLLIGYPSLWVPPLRWPLGGGSAIGGSGRAGWASHSPTGGLVGDDLDGGR